MNLANLDLITTHYNAYHNKSLACLISLVCLSVGSVLHHAPLIPAGMNPFHWNLQESGGMGQESAGMGRNPQEWTGMAPEWTKIDILELRE